MRIGEAYSYNEDTFALSVARPDLCLGIAGCWGSLYWLLRGVCCLVVRECFCCSWGTRWESLKKG